MPRRRSRHSRNRRHDLPTTTVVAGACLQRGRLMPTTAGLHLVASVATAALVLSIAAVGAAAAAVSRPAEAGRELPQIACGAADSTTTTSNNNNNNSRGGAGREIQNAPLAPGAAQQAQHQQVRFPKFLASRPSTTTGGGIPTTATEANARSLPPAAEHDPSATAGEVPEAGGTQLLLVGALEGTGDGCGNNDRVPSEWTVNVGSSASGGGGSERRTLSGGKNGNTPRRGAPIDADASQHGSSRDYSPAGGATVVSGSAGRGIFSGWLPTAAVAVEVEVPTPPSTGSTAEDSGIPDTETALQAGTSGDYCAPTATAAATAGATAPSGNGQLSPPSSSSALPPQPEGLSSPLATPLIVGEPAPVAAAAWQDAAVPSDAAASQPGGDLPSGRALLCSEGEGGAGTMTGVAGYGGASVGGGSMAVAAVAAHEILRVAKLMAAAGVIFRTMRWLTGAVCSTKKWAGLQLRRPADNRGLTGSEEDSLRRAREQVLMQAGGTRVPVEVIPSLSASELEVAADLVDCDRLDVTFEDIAGMEGVKRSLQDIISEPLDFPPELYPARLIKPCTGILIYGPPGCGKTLLARAVAKQSSAAFISVKASTLMKRSGAGPAAGGGGRFRADGEGHAASVMVRAVFSLARKIQPCIVFFDEADGLCFKREEGDAGAGREAMTELMQLWDGLSSSGQDRVVVLAATNRPWDLDPAVQVGLPDRKMRKAVLMKALEDVEVEEGFDWRELAVNTEGYSCGDVVELCREAVRGPLREAMDRNRRRAARRQSQGLHQSRAKLQERQQQQKQQEHKRRHRGEWQAGAGSMASETMAAAAASAEAASLPPVRMRPLRMSDVTAAQHRVVPAFWQAEAYRATYDGYMCSLMEHARQNWSR